MNNTLVEQIVLDAAAATGAGQEILVDTFRHAVFSFATDGGGDANLTVKFAGSIQESKPDFDSAASPTNMWDYIQVADLENGNKIAGDTGIGVSAADDYRLLEANINHLNWITAIVTARSEGEVTVKVKLSSE